jgi:hypothetical protein
MKMTDVKGLKYTGELSMERNHNNKMDLCSVKGAPSDCIPCSLCGFKSDMYVEMPEYGDWKNGSFVARIGCVCDKSMQGYRDFNRTRFEDLIDAIVQWNEMQREEITEDSEVSF